MSYANMNRPALFITIILSCLTSSCFASDSSPLETQVITPGFPMPVLVENISASSTLANKKYSNFAYHPTNIYDDDNKTAWFEGVDGDGVGEYVELEFFVPLNIKSLSFVNGYSKSDTLFHSNGSIKKLKIISHHVVRSTTNTIELKHTHKTQSFPLRLNSVKKIKLIIESTYPGKHYEDTGFSEIQVDADIAVTLPSKLSDEQVKRIHDRYKNNFVLDTQESEHLNLVTGKQLKHLMSREYDDVEEFGTNYDRFSAFLNVATRKSALTPEFLRSSLQPSTLFPIDNNAENIYIVIAKKVWGNSPVAIPYIKKNLEPDYHTLYDLLNRGDTRVVPQYLQILKSQGIWHELCCKKMPGDILSAKGDHYTLKQIENFLSSTDVDEDLAVQLNVAKSALNM